MRGLPGRTAWMRAALAVVLSTALAVVTVPPNPVADASPVFAVPAVLPVTQTGDISLQNTSAIASVSPSSGSVAGGTSVTITLSNVTLGSASQIAVTVGATTTVITATTSSTVQITTSESPNRAAGAVTVEVFVVVDGDSATLSLPFGYTYRPVLEAVRTSGFGDWGGTNSRQLFLGSFASRTQGKQLTSSGTTGERTITGIDSRTNEAYSFSTDRSDYSGTTGKGNEGTEVQSFTSWNGYQESSVTFLGRGGVRQLSGGNYRCSHNNSNPVTKRQSFCSVFGPEVYSEPFFASSTQALSFDWAAQYISDDYEVYGFLVRVDDPVVSTAIPTRATALAANTAADTGHHSVVMYSRGCRGNLSGCIFQTSWFTSSGNVPADGHYRFRFVNGTWDYSGGYVLGARMLLDPTIVVGAANVISFPDPGSRFGPAGHTFTLPVFSSALTPVTLTSTTPAVCTVSSVSVTEATIAIVGSGTNRVCTLQASQGTVGSYAPASTVTHTFSISGPAAPVTAPVITSAAGQNQSILVEFTPPTNDGGLDILDYEYRVDGGSETTVTLGAATSFAISGLTNGTEYQIELRARNALGFSPWSAVVAATPAVPPAAPAITAAAGQNEAVHVQFTPPADDGGLAVLDYEYRVDGGTESTVTVGAATSFTVTGLSNGTEYGIELRARNAMGFSPWSSVATATPVGPPGSSPVITAATGQNQSILVEFIPPTDDGGLDILDYEYRVDGGSEITVTVGAATSFTVTGLSNGTEYQIELRARNALGFSPWSATVAATPAASFAVSVALPAPPTGPVITGAPPDPLVAPTGTIGGRPAAITVVPTPPPLGSTTSTAVEVTAGTGTTRFGVDLTGVGVVTTAIVDGLEVPVLAVTRDTVAAASGSGMLPRSTVQFWLPRDGDDIRKVIEIEVGPDGTFAGALPFDGSTDDRPLPIGIQVLQLIGTDPEGEQVVVNLTVRIDQPAPAPEIERSRRAIPTVAPGQVLVTNAREVEVVDLVVDPDNGRTTLESRGWNIALDIPNAAGRILRTDTDGTLIEIVRGEEALVTGTGFMPGTRADVWLFSTPTLLGSVSIGEDGLFSAPVTIDGEAVDVGTHTLQLQGIGFDGYARAANLGLFVVDSATAGDRRLPAAGADLTAWWILALAIMGIGALLVRGRDPQLTRMG